MERLAACYTIHCWETSDFLQQRTEHRTFGIHKMNHEPLNKITNENARVCNVCFLPFWASYSMDKDSKVLACKGPMWLLNSEFHMDSMQWWLVLPSSWFHFYHNLNDVTHVCRFKVDVFLWKLLSYYNKTQNLIKIKFGGIAITGFVTS